MTSTKAAPGLNRNPGNPLSEGGLAANNTFSYPLQHKFQFDPKFICSGNRAPVLRKVCICQLQLAYVLLNSLVIHPEFHVLALLPNQ